MEAYRTSNIGYIRQSYTSRAEENIPSNTEERITYEQRQVALIRILKILLVLFFILSLPLFYNLFRYGGLTNSCGQQQSVGSIIWSPIRWLFGFKNDGGCHKSVSSDLITDDKYKIETTTETTTCNKGGRGERTLGAVLGEEKINPEAMDGYSSFDALAIPSGDGDDGSGSKGGSFWDFFRLPSFGCSEYNEQKKQLEELKPSVGFFRSIMPSIEEVTKNYPKYAQLVGDVSRVTGLADNDVGEVRELFSQILDPLRPWKKADESSLGAIIKKPLEWLMNIKNVFSIQGLIGDWKRSGANINKKKDYVTTLKNKLDVLPDASKRCFDRQTDLNGQLNDLNTKMSGLLAEKGNLENQIQENQLKLNSFISQRNSKEQEPINTVRQLDLDLQALKFKIGSMPGIRADLDAKLKAILKAEEDLAEIRRKLNADESYTYDLQKKIDDGNLTVEGLKHGMEGNKIKLAMRKMKLQLANSNRQIKEYLMTLIRTNNGEPIDFQQLVSSNESTRREIRRILKEFINQSAGMHVEISISEAQLDEIIAKDQKEFDEIRKIYTELVNIINLYGDFNVYISGIARDIQDLEGKLATDDRTVNDWLRKIREWKAIVDGASARRSGWNADIIRLEKFISDGRKYIEDKEFEMRGWNDEYEKLRLRKELFMQEHKVG